MIETAEAREVDPKYPVGKFTRTETVTPHQRMAAIATLAELPGKLSEAVEGLEDRQLLSRAPILLPYSALANLLQRGVFTWLVPLQRFANPCEYLTNLHIFNHSKHG